MLGFNKKVQHGGHHTIGRDNRLLFLLVDGSGKTKSICLTYEGVKHPCSILNNAVSGVANLKQSDDEHPKDFAEKVKNRVNILFDNLINIFKEENSDCLNKDPKQRKAIEESALEKYMACLFIVKSSKNIYKDLKDNMKQQHLLGIKQYPETLTKAMEIWNQNYSRSRRDQIG